MDDRKKESTDAVDCPEHNELFGLNQVNPNQQLMHLMDKIYKKINLEDFGDLITSSLSTTAYGTLISPSASP